MQALLSGERNEAEMEDGNQTALNGRFRTPTRPAQPQERLRRAPTRQSKATMMLTPHFLHLGDMATGACSAGICWGTAAWVLIAALVHACLSTSRGGS